MIYYTCQEVADRYRVKVTTVWGWINDKKLHALKLGREYRISQKDLDEFEKRDD